MSLANMKEMLGAARKAKKAVGAFNVTNYETAAAVLKAAEAAEMDATSAISVIDDGDVEALRKAVASANTWLATAYRLL